MASNDGDPAFPWSRNRHPQEALNSITSGSGMTLRDYFAAKSIDYAWNQESRYAKNPSYAGTAERAYMLADAMLRERDK